MSSVHLYQTFMFKLMNTYIVGFGSLTIQLFTGLSIQHHNLCTENLFIVLNSITGLGLFLDIRFPRVPAALMSIYLYL